ncbi:MAG: ribonuclease Z [candidate division NC10 bacterium]|nr:ribonuclease Z [candidate division NC10 bacterium]
MASIFHARLIHDPFNDPGVFVRLQWERRAFLFDLGDLSPLPPGELLKVTDVFISHAHMDHFIGFDQLLRVLLGREKALRLFGPPGILGHVEGKLKGFTWNLVDDYPLVLEVHEIHPGEIRSASFPCRERFERRDLGRRPFHGVLLDEPLFIVKTVHLDHRIPCLAFALEEKVHLNIDKDRLDNLGWPVGPWLGELKRQIQEGRPDESLFVARWRRDEKVEERVVTLGELKVQVVRMREGQKIAYVTDILYSEENRAKVVKLAKDADLFFCEATYLERDLDKAEERYHLTARQAGSLAREAGNRKLVLFHFSPRYRNESRELYREAEEAFGGAVVVPLKSANAASG